MSGIRLYLFYKNYKFVIYILSNFIVGKSGCLRRAGCFQNSMLNKYIISDTHCTATAGLFPVIGSWCCCIRYQMWGQWWTLGFPSHTNYISFLFVIFTHVSYQTYGVTKTSLSQNELYTYKEIIPILQNHT